MTHVVGFAGRAESGKSTAAEMLHSIVLPENGQHIEFSEPILAMAQAWMDISEVGESQSQIAKNLYEVAGGQIDAISLSSLVEEGVESPLLGAYLKNRTETTVINSETKHEHRKLLEWLGKGVVTHASPTYWSDTVKQKATRLIEAGADLITLGGVRSGFDAEATKHFGGTIIKLTRGNTSELLPSEAGINAWRADYDIDNNGTFDELRLSLQIVWEDVCSIHYGLERRAQ